MARENEFVAYVLELISPLGAVSSRAMFGGYGIYAGSQIIAIVIDDTLYLKADEESRTLFDERGLEPFSYTSRGKTYAMSYFRAPDDAFDAPHAMLPWARAALAAALRKAGGKPARKRQPQPKPRALARPTRGR